MMSLLTSPDINTPPHTEAFEIQMRKAFLRLQYAKQYENAQLWDLAFLQKYLELAITPRGLRVKKQCSFLDEDLTKEWHMISEFCTTKWIKILVQQREWKLKAAEQQVLERNQAAQAFSSSCHFSKWAQVQDSNIKKDEDNMISKKNKKLERDIMDYKTGQVFEWKRSAQDQTVNTTQIRHETYLLRPTTNTINNNKKNKEKTKIKVNIKIININQNMYIHMDITLAQFSPWSRNPVRFICY